MLSAFQLRDHANDIVGLSAQPDRMSLLDPRSSSLRWLASSIHQSTGSESMSALAPSRNSGNAIQTLAAYIGAHSTTLANLLVMVGDWAEWSAYRSDTRLMGKMLKYVRTVLRAMFDKGSFIRHFPVFCKSLIDPSTPQPAIANDDEVAEVNGMRAMPAVIAITMGLDQAAAKAVLAPLSKAISLFVGSSLHRLRIIH